MHDFVSHVLRQYWDSVGWNASNSYLHLTSTSSAVLDFPVPSGLCMSISASPSPPFFTTYRLRALPQLSGALGYLFASTDEEAPKLDVGNSADVSIKSMTHRFRILDVPRRPTGKEQVWQAGKRVDTRDYLLYGCMHVPSSRVDALYTTRLSPTVSLLITALSHPSKTGFHFSERSSSAPSGGSGSTTEASQPAPAQPQAGRFKPGSTNMQIMLQRDTGRWFTEYSYSADDALWGFRVLHNFGAPQDLNDVAASTNGESLAQTAAAETISGALDENTESAETGVGGGLQGRFSAGAEVFFSAREKSAGISTGLRFTTLPEHPNATSSSANAAADEEASEEREQPPTTLTATLNPMMGHLSTAYAARMTRDIVACSRFDFNVYSYDSELTVGAEYWLRASPRSSSAVPPASSSTTVAASTSADLRPERALRAPSLRDDTSLRGPPSPPSTPALSLREAPPTATLVDTASDDPSHAATLRDPSPSLPVAQLSDVSTPTAPTLVAPSSGTPTLAPLLGVIKARLSSSGALALLWEGRLRNTLLSIGFKADLSPAALSAAGKMGPIEGTSAGGGKVLRGVGLELLYFTSSEEAKEELGRRKERQG